MRALSRMLSLWSREKSVLPLVRITWTCVARIQIFSKKFRKKIHKKYKKIIRYFVRETQVFGFVQKKAQKGGFFKELW